MAHRGFETFSEAFDYCREADHPVQVVITGEGQMYGGLYKLYPSGMVKFIRLVQKHEEMKEEG